MDEKEARFGVKSGQARSWSWFLVIGATLLILNLPLYYVDIPPLVDIPGHTAAAAIESARPDNPVLNYYRWHWALNLNMGGEVLMKLLGGELAAGWWATWIATTLFILGTVSAIRILNPIGHQGLPWALIFAFGFPWIWGFLNFILATGLSLLGFVAAERFKPRPLLRGGLFAAAQLIAMLCHAIGGLLLSVLIVASAIGEATDKRSALPGGGVLAGADIGYQIVRRCWPLAVSGIIVLLWSIGMPRQDGPALQWDWKGKVEIVGQVLRDQSKPLDIATVVLSYAVLLFGWTIGARWRRQQAAPALAVLVLYLLIPTRIGGSMSIDTRLFSVAILLALGSQDWSGARPAAARAVALSGTAMLVARLAFMTIGFIRYDADYRAQLQALDHVRAASRMFVLVEHSCGKSRWRLSRLDTLPALASIRKQVWINAHWTIPGLDMLESRYEPLRNGQPVGDISVWDPKCPGPGRQMLDVALARVPYQAIDYLWLLDTGAPSASPPQLKLLWHWKRSFLYQVGHAAGSAG